MGYELTVPEGTFYVLVRSPLVDDGAFIALLAEQNIFCLPGEVFEMPGYFRISLTANDQMVEKALPGFEKALQAAKVKT
jgi:aspartate aminotransferase